MNRYQQYGLIHKGMKTKLTIELGAFSDEDYRRCLASMTGKSSCKEMNHGELESIIAHLKERQYLDKPKPRYQPVKTHNPNRPTDAQWRKLAALCYGKGWLEGLKDKALTAFVKRTAGVSNVRFLTKQSISDVITGLEKWS
ncbi:regulatory protein GemA [Vibrio sp. OPT18]|uniref:regulatory protein GemA n=1 Tax=Vibrio sp. OPT18 TaxID=2778641 RepID=UPI00187E9B32|nr:regulatory protein GemA [Vibrio sp. OPT18]MBE8578698.1 regulatory protein GemA [Vibrio sp. OPT18]